MRRQSSSLREEGLLLDALVHVDGECADDELDEGALVQLVGLEHQILDEGLVHVAILHVVALLLLQRAGLQHDEAQRVEVGGRPVHHAPVAEGSDALWREVVLGSGPEFLEVVGGASQDVGVVQLDTVGAPEHRVGAEVVVPRALLLEVQQRLVTLSLRRPDSLTSEGGLLTRKASSRSFSSGSGSIDFHQFSRSRD
jgi:hypothetical protein